MTAQKNWWQDGVQFACQGSGKCCTSHGEYGFVFLTPDDRKRMAQHLKVSTSAFTRKYCQKYNGAFHLKEDRINPDCIFLEGKRCGIYEARPTQCRTWPFWPEVMNAKTWKKEVLSFCPGVGKGQTISAAKIKEQLLIQETAEQQIIAEARRSSK
jgi:Fe-S-cluster containining protein